MPRKKPEQKQEPSNGAAAATLQADGQPEPPNQEQVQVLLARAGLQNYTYREVKRSEIQTATYNPRVMSSYARQQLKGSLDSFGLVEPLVWNENTGVLVSGHQRLSLIDEQQCYPNPCTDYLIGVAVVKLTVKREKALNVYLNNKAAQGSFDEKMFADYLRGEPTLTLADIGFTKVDLEFEFGTAEVFEVAEQHQEEEASPIKQSLEEIKARRKQSLAQFDERKTPLRDADYFILVAFNSADEKNNWLRNHGFPMTQRYLNIAEVELAIRPEVPSEPEDEPAVAVIEAKEARATARAGEV